MRSLFTFSALIIPCILLLSACRGGDEVRDPVEDMAPVGDMGSDSSPDMERDFGEDDLGRQTSCDQIISASEAFELVYQDSVSVEYETPILPSLEGGYRGLTLLFENYSFGPDIGTFALGPGTPNENFGNCPQCVYIKGEARERAYFATAGELLLDADPYSRRLSVSVRGLELTLVEVGEARQSTPIQGAPCVAVEDFTFAGTFPEEGWTCEASRYLDGVQCDCECGAVDPDCNGPSCLPGDTACQEAYVPLPVAGCEASEQCLFDPETMGLSCVSSCDWEARAPCADGASTCLFDSGSSEGSTCIESGVRFVDVAVGEPCPEDGIFQLYCALDGQFANGYCDPAYVCRSVCKGDDECTEPDHTCRFFLGEEGLGYCGPEPPEDG